MTEHRNTAWSTLPSDDWTDTIEAVHLWTQIVGKIRLGYSSWLNHSWGVPLYVSTRGLRTSMIPFGTDAAELEFDFVDHALSVHTTAGRDVSIPLQPRSVADVYQHVLDAMATVGMPVSINPMPTEIPDAIPFDHDTAVRSYDPGHANALWRALVQADRVLTRFRADFKGKASPVHFFWGSFDLATTRFSGRTAPPHPGGIANFPDDVAREAYSHELTSVGFWPGNRDAPEPIFYSYAYPTPDGFSAATIEPAEAKWLDDLGEFALPYNTVATADDADDADATLASFFHTTHAAAAELAHWDRANLECVHPEGPDWWQNRPHQTS
ncbi:MAG: DUF5996 family protein [Gemmatimonadota bacterium]